MVHARVVREEVAVGTDQPLGEVCQPAPVRLRRETEETDDVSVAETRDREAVGQAPLQEDAVDPGGHVARQPFAQSRDRSLVRSARTGPRRPRDDPDGASSGRHAAQTPGRLEQPDMDDPKNLLDRHERPRLCLLEHLPQAGKIGRAFLPQAIEAGGWDPALTPRGQRVRTGVPDRRVGEIREDRFQLAARPAGAPGGHTRTRARRSTDPRAGREEAGIATRARQGANAVVSATLARVPGGLWYVFWTPFTVSVTVIVYSTLDRAP